jgi:xanthine dehydrogenase accessory factor
MRIEGVTGSCVKNSDEVRQTLMRRELPIVVDPKCQFLNETGFDVFTLIDARMIKQPPDLGLDAASLVVGLGPGFEATINCDAVIETNRGHNLGRVIWKGSPESDTGVPGLLGDKGKDRVLRAPADGIIRNKVRIGAIVKRGQIIAKVGEEAIYAPYGGLLRGLIHDNFSVRKNMKIGDLDPRKNREYAVTVSDKSLAVAGGVLEALLSRSDIRYKLWS